MKQNEYNKEVILFNLAEMQEELLCLITELGNDDPIDTSEFDGAFAHIYHHLNTAWNARFISDADWRKQSEVVFFKNRQFPKDIDMH